MNNVKPIDRYPSDRVVIGKELTSLEDIVMENSNREIECPDCGEILEVEPDARYKFKCDGCGVQIKCSCMM